MKKMCLLVSGIIFLSIELTLSSCSSQFSTPTPEALNHPLPRSMKGYEIYSWQEDGGWIFKLMTGTNRQKTIEEIISNSEAIQDGTLINIKIIGVDDLKKTLGNLPKEESVFWMSPNGLETTADQAIPIEYPPDAMIEDIRGFSEQIGVDLVLSQ